LPEISNYLCGDSVPIIWDDDYWAIVYLDTNRYKDLNSR